ESYPAWELFDATLRRLDIGRSPEMARFFFALQLLSHLGFRPQLVECVACGEPLAQVPNFVSARAVGGLCPACGRQEPSGRPRGGNALRVLRAIQRGEWPLVERVRLGEALHRELEGTLEAFVHHALERELKSSEMLRAMRLPAAVPSPATA